MSRAVSLTSWRVAQPSDLRAELGGGELLLAAAVGELRLLGVEALHHGRLEAEHVLLGVHGAVRRRGLGLREASRDCRRDASEAVAERLEDFGELLLERHPRVQLVAADVASAAAVAVAAATVPAAAQDEDEQQPQQALAVREHAVAVAVAVAHHGGEVGEVVISHSHTIPSFRYSVV